MNNTSWVRVSVFIYVVKNHPSARLFSLFLFSLHVEIFLVGLVNVWEPFLGMLEAIPWLERSAPVQNARVLQRHVLPLIDGLHLDIPRQG